VASRAICPPLTLDSADLSEEEAAEVERLLGPLDLEAVGGEERRSAPERHGRAPDAFRYELDIEVGGRREWLELGEGEVPAELRPLLTHLTRLARGRRGGGRGPRTGA
jgi:hypothetical protein